jgi:hypothetical protein
MDVQMSSMTPDGGPEEPVGVIHEVTEEADGVHVRGTITAPGGIAMPMGRLEFPAFTAIRGGIRFVDAPKIVPRWRRFLRQFSPWWWKAEAARHEAAAAEWKHKHDELEDWAEKVRGAVNDDEEDAW